MIDAPGVLGATGTVGQRFIQLLSTHPQFKITHLGASPRSANRPYHLAVNWKLSTAIPLAQMNLIVLACDDPLKFQGCKIIFSGLDSDVAGDVELSFMRAGFCVFSNAMNHRNDPLVPLCVPLVNTDHMDIITHQRSIHNTTGFIVTNANCSTTGLVVALKALQDAFGQIDSVMVTTMQAISGAGYPGIASLDIIDNVIPFISGEEEKLEREPLKILGDLNESNTAFIENTIKISACCNRVAVIDGHTEAVSVSFVNRPAPTPEEVNDVLASYRAPHEDLHMSPPFPIVVRLESDRPQPRLDRDTGKGQAITVGRVRTCAILDIKFTLLSHNTILGAAGSSILNAEIALKKNLINL